MGGLDPNTDWGTGNLWMAEPKTDSGIGSLNAGGNIALTASDDGDWTPTPLAATWESFLMEFIVFPFLAAMVSVLAVSLLVLRVRRRRSRRRTHQLLQA